MKTNLKNRLLNRSTIAVSLCALATASTLSAADQTWTNSASSLIWDTSATNWTGAAWTDGNNAIFGATGEGAITVNGTVSVPTLALTSSANGIYSFTGGTLQATPVALADETTGWNFNNGATINSAITAPTLTGSQNVNIRTQFWANSGKLTITGPVTMSGTGANNWFRPDGWFLFKDNTVTLTNVGLAPGYNRGATYGFENSTVSITSEATSGSNRGISFTAGTMNVTNSTITTPYALIGNGGGATLNMTSGTFTTGQLVSNPYSGASTSTLNLNGGTIALTELTRPAQNVGSTTTVNLNLNGGVLKALANNTAFINVVGSDGTLNAKVMAGGAKIDSNGFNITIAPALVSGVAGDGGLLKSGAGTLTLSATNTYLGTTTVSGGTLLATKAASLPGYNAASKVTVASGATLAVSAGAASGEWISTEIDSLLGATAAAFASGSNLGIEVATGNTFSYATDVGTTQAAKGLVKTGAGTLTLSATNTYTGKTLINGGKLSIANESGLGSNPGSSTADQLTFNGGTLLTTATLSIDDANRGITLGASGGTFEVSTGTTTIAATNVIAGAGGLTKTGAGNLTLSGNNTYAGTTTINSTASGGLLIVNHNNALGSTAGGTVVNGANNWLTTGLQLANGVTVTGETLTLATTGGNAMLSSASGATATWAGNINVTGNAVAILNAQNGSLTVNGDITRSVNGFFYLWGSAGASGTLNGTVNLGSQEVVIDNATWTLNSAVTWGNTILKNTASKLVLGVANALPTTTVLTFGADAPNGGTLALNGNNQTVAGLANVASTTGKIVNGQATAATLTVNNSTARTYDGVLGGTGTNENNFGLTKTGTSTLTLTGANTYSGNTNVSGGTLAIAGGGSTSVSSAVSVSAGSVTNTPVATLAGNGTVGGNVSLTAESSSGFKNGGVLAPTAAATGTRLSVTGTTTFGTGSIFEWNMSATTPASNPGVVSNSGSYGQLAGTGTIGGSSAVFQVVLGAGNAFTDAFWDSNKAWNNVFTGTGATNALTSIFSSISGTGITYASNQGLVAGQGYFTFSGTNTLNWTAVPEPTSALAGLLIGAGMLRRRRTA